MKKILFLTMAISLIIFSCNQQTEVKETAVAEPQTAETMVYYFHYDHRCATCNAVEDVTKNSLNELYAGLVKDGKIAFQSVNLDEKEGEAIGEKLEVAGQELLIIKGDKKTDLTELAFMYARSNPEKLKAAIKEVIDGLVE
jgi:hypothetical protein